MNVSGMFIGFKEYVNWKNLFKEIRKQAVKKMSVAQLIGKNYRLSLDIAESYFIAKGFNAYRNTEYGQLKN